MLEPREALYQWGMQVMAVVDLINDGTYPEKPLDAVLVAAGDTGEIVQIGHHAEANMPVYIVEFEGHRVVGCLEEEIAPAALIHSLVKESIAASAAQTAGT